MDPVYLRRSNWMESVPGPSKFSLIYNAAWTEVFCSEVTEIITHMLSNSGGGGITPGGEVLLRRPGTEHEPSDSDSGDMGV